MLKKKVTGFALDEKVMKELDKEKNKSKFVNDLLIKFYFEKKEKDKNDLRIISDFIQEMKTLDFKADKLNELLKINVHCSSIAMQTIKAIKSEFTIKEQAELINEQVKTQINRINKYASENTNK